MKLNIRRPPYWSFAAVAALAVGLAGTALPRPAAGVRPPYLQNDQGDHIIVCWTTSRQIPSEVRVRRVGETTEQRFGANQPGRRHQVTLTGLQLGAAFEYRARTDEGDTPWRRFRTRPEDSAPFRFAVFGDYGSGLPGQGVVTRLLEREDPDFGLVVGDLVYPTGSETTLTTRFFRPLERYASGHVLWHVFGNHDVAAERGMPLERASATPENGPAASPRRTYSFDYGDAHFVVLDSNMGGTAMRRSVRPWLIQDLQRTDRRWKFVFLHHPPYSTGDHGDSRSLQATMVPVFRQYGVDAVFAGHDHSYQRFHPIDGVRYVVTGAGGASLYPWRRTDRRIAFRDNRRHGLTIVRVDGERVVVRQVTESGELDRAEWLPR